MRRARSTGGCGVRTSRAGYTPWTVAGEAPNFGSGGVAAAGAVALRSGGLAGRAADPVGQRGPAAGVAGRADAAVGRVVRGPRVLGGRTRRLVADRGRGAVGRGAPGAARWVRAVLRRRGS